MRVLFRNLLPNGEAGDLFLPVDTTLMGSGMGPNAVTLDANGVPMDSAADLGSVLDAVRNPMCGDTPKDNVCFAENRATLHLHGGVTPWISDGTPHQWITPAGPESFTDYPEGVSVSNVPDMPDYGPGTQTFFYTNQQSARLMWTHDHAWGITRLNVLAGEAAGYLVTDDDRDGPHRHGRGARRSRSRNATGHPGQDVRLGERRRGRDVRRRRYATSHDDRSDLELRQVGRRGQHLDAACVHARPEPG